MKWADRKGYYESDKGYRISVVGTTHCAHPPSKRVPKNGIYDYREFIPEVLGCFHGKDANANGAKAKKLCEEHYGERHANRN